MLDDCSALLFLGKGGHWKGGEWGKRGVSDLTESAAFTAQPWSICGGSMPKQGGKESAMLLLDGELHFAYEEGMTWNPKP